MTNANVVTFRCSCDFIARLNQPALPLLEKDETA